ncbi:hypothetical protein CGQ24_13905 [Arthrobacter sp. 7749]|nr:hypothetical protein CGQ24_13905 [Arthrobacter sp. 7749]
MNEFIAFKQPLPVALGFLAISGGALLSSFLLAIIALVISIIETIRRKANFGKCRATVDQLKIWLEQVKLQIAFGNFVDARFQTEGDITEVLPKRTH